MADWDGLRRDLERGVTPPPLDALRARRRHRQQRRTIATACAVVMAGGAAGFAVLDGGARREGPAGVAILGRVVTNQTALPPRDYRDYVVTDVDFVTPAAGWAVGLRCAGESCDVATFRTHDGGGTWAAPVGVARGVPRTAFHQEVPGSGAARSIRMLDERTGYVFNPSLWVTADGGATWTRAEQSGKVVSISPAGDTAWVTARDCAGDGDCALSVRSGDRRLDLPPTGNAPALVRRSSRDHGYLLTWDPPAFHRTSDQGRTWRRGLMPCPDADAVAMSAPSGGPLWVVCATPGGRRAFRSADHGASWYALAAPPGDGEVTDLVARSATEAYVATQQPGRLWATRDGGATWQDTGVGTAYGYLNVDVLDATHAFAMGDAGQLWRTTDGARWERLALPPGATRATAPAPPPGPRGLRASTVNPTTWTGLFFLDADRGWAVGHQCPGGTCRAVVRRTGDGGETWTRVPAPAGTWPEHDEVHPPNVVTRVAFADDRNGWLFGDSVLATSDGGTTWREIRNGYTYDVVPRGEFVWSVGYEGCASNPCGATIGRDRVTAGDFTPVGGYTTGSHLRGSFAAPTARHAYYVDRFGRTGGNPLLAGTADGGRTWTSHPAPCPDSDRTLAAYAPDGLWVLCAGVGEQGRQSVALSGDGGATWTTRPLPGTGEVLGEIVPLSATVAWRTGATRGLLVTRDGGRTWDAVPNVTARTSAPAFADERHGWLLAGGALWRTTDGATWERVG